MMSKIAPTYQQFEHSPSYANIDLNKEQNRLVTFFGWPKAEWISPVELARFGFYYLENNDSVRCHFCNIDIGGWEQHDDVVREHLRWSPHCPLMTRRRTDNVPLDESFLNRVPQLCCDTVGVSDASTSSRMWTAEPLPTTATYNSHVLANETTVKQSRPLHAAYAIFNDRFKTFKDWPSSLAQKPAQLCDAGFFYTGKSDHVTCFSCGGSLRSWEPNDDPWQEHAKYYGDCHYLRLYKGQEFIKRCQAQKTVEPNGELSTLVDDSDPRDTRVKPTVSEERLCIICYDNEYNTVFMPCGHVVACTRCASSVVRCPMCNEPYTSVLRVHLP